MSRKIVGAFLMLVILIAVPAILFAAGEDVSLDTLVVWIDEIVHHQEGQDARLDEIEERLIAVEERLVIETATPEPTITLAGTDTATLAPETNAFLIVTRKMNVRRGPETHHAILGAAETRSQFAITGKNLNGDWWQIDYDGQPGWVYAPYVEYVAISDSASVPIVPTPTPFSTAVTVLPTATATVQVQTEAMRLSRLLAINDYEGSGRGNFLRLSENEQEQRIAFYEPLFVEVMEKCDLEESTMFWVLNSHSNKLDRAGISARMDNPPRAFWLTWISENGLPASCDVFVRDTTFDILDEYE